MNKKKIFNDPVYGFINIPYEIIFDLIEHPYFQRLRRIKQLGLTSLVYPGALHTRFHHALGAMHLMTQAIEILRSKGHSINENEATAATIAILLHDIGHGPYSHSLENIIIHDIKHEDISLLFMEKLNEEYDGKLSLAIQIFKNEYKKKFLHQLVSSQLDVDRLDYLTRDSFYTGVSEGEVGYNRIIKMLDVFNDELVVEHKGIYSIENFIVARRLMYWQVYFHKAVIAAEHLLVNILKRAKELAESGVDLFATPALKMFLYGKIDGKCFKSKISILNNFSELDDYDIFASLKVWAKHNDKILSLLCSNLVNRHMYRVELQKEPFTDEYINSIRNTIKKKYCIKNDLEYFVFMGKIENNAYDTSENKINILYKNNVIDIAEASDKLNISVLSEPVKKYFLYYPKDCRV